MYLSAIWYYKTREI